MEALVRWQHPTRGLLSPALFIPLAEEAGLITTVTDWVLEEACRATRRWQQRYPSEGPLSVSVNLSAREFDRGTIEDRVAGVLERTGLPPSCLTLEVTESSLMHGSKTLRTEFAALKGLGVELAIDDFGTGYSALSRLQKLPFDILKIDRSFVSSLGQSKRDVMLMEGLLHLARGLSLRVVAEGVEQAEQARILRSLGCDYGQGYHFSRPLPEGEVERLLAMPFLPAKLESRSGTVQQL